MGKAFNAVLDAEKAGANVTQLLAKLNTAGQLLSEAQNAYANGNNAANVASMVENINQIARQISTDALNLRNESLIESMNRIEFTLIFSVVGGIVFSILLFFVWRRFKRTHVEKVLGMKPEVEENST